MIEFSEWNTPFRKGDLHIVSVEYGTGPYSITYHEPKRTYSLNEDHPEDSPAVVAKILDTKSETLYRLSFQTVTGFRVLDEHGLTEIWGMETYDPKELGGTFMVRGHSWHKESPITFVFGIEGEWSYMVATNDECLEIVSASPPIIKSLGKLTPR